MASSPSPLLPTKFLPGTCNCVRNVAHAHTVFFSTMRSPPGIGAGAVTMLRSTCSRSCSKYRCTGPRAVLAWYMVHPLRYRGLAQLISRFRPECRGELSCASAPSFLFFSLHDESEHEYAATISSSGTRLTMAPVVFPISTHFRQSEYHHDVFRV